MARAGASTARVIAVPERSTFIRAVSTARLITKGSAKAADSDFVGVRGRDDSVAAYGPFRTNSGKGRPEC